MSIEAQLKSFFTRHWSYMAVATACQIHLFDAIAQGKTWTVNQLAATLDLNGNALQLLVSALTSDGFLEENEGRHGLTPLSERLTEQHPKSLKYACMNWSEEHLTVWQSLESSLKTGKAAFPMLYGTAFFDYLKGHPQKLRNYHKAMFEYGRDDYFHLPTLFNFAEWQSVIDIGGGLGAAVHRIKQQHPKLQCALFDLPEVIQHTNTIGIQQVAGNFLQSVPADFQVQILGRVLHDWNNEKALTILKNCYRALPEKGRLLIMENCQDLMDEDLSLLSLNMLLLCESHERTSAQYIELAQKAGFHWLENRPLNRLQTVMIFTK